MPPSFIAHRKVVLSEGFGYTTMKEYITKTDVIEDRENRQNLLFLEHFSYILERRIFEIQKENFFVYGRKPSMDRRLGSIKNKIEALYGSYKQLASVYLNDGKNQVYKLPPKTACYNYLPPCLEKIQKIFTEHGEMSFQARPIYVNFMTNIGFNINEIGRMFEIHYKKKSKKERGEKLKQCKIEVERFAGTTTKNIHWSCSAIQNRGDGSLCPHTKNKNTCAGSRQGKRPTVLPDIEDLGEFYSPFGYYKSIFLSNNE